MSGTAAATPQSSLHAGSVQAASFGELSAVLSVGAAALLLGVMLLLALSLGRARPVRVRLWLVGGGIALPVAVLTALFFYGESRRPDWRPMPPADALVVTVTAHLWWWDIRYSDPRTGAEFVTANEVRLPVGRPVYFALASGDVIHSFWVPALGGKMDMVPGRLQHLLVQPTAEGRWRGQCAEYCGEQHARMALDVLVVAPQAFERWSAAQARPASVAESHPGLQAFEKHRCSFCHRVRGVADEASRGLGPDLTHVGGRLSLAAASLPNTPQNLRSWITHTQQLKAGARMPSGAGRVPDHELEDIAAWLSTLK